MKLKVSVIVTAYRRTDFLHGALESVRAQTLPPLEVVVTDDSAEPAIRSIVAGYEDGALRYRSNPTPLGGAGNVKAALQECHGDAFAVLNDDDLWEPTLLERLAEPLTRLPQVGVAFCDHWVIDAQGDVEYAQSQLFSQRYGRASLVEGVVRDTAAVAVVGRSVPAAIAALFRREVVSPDEIPIEVLGAYDYWLSCQAAATGRPFYYVAERLARYRLHGAMESRRPSASGSEGHRAVLAEVRRRGWFPALSRELRRSWAGVHCDCGLERLLHGEGDAARFMFLTALRQRPSLRALAGLGLALAPQLGRSALLRRRAAR